MGICCHRRDIQFDDQSVISSQYEGSNSLFFSRNNSDYRQARRRRLRRLNQRNNHSFLSQNSQISRSSGLLEQIIMQRERGVYINDIGLLFQLYIDLRAQNQIRHSQNLNNGHSNLFQFFQLLQQIPQSRGLTKEQISSLTKMKAVNGQLDCPVCQDVIKKGQQILVLSCNHPFHTQCIIQWLQKSNKCPMCRQEVRV